MYMDFNKSENYFSEDCNFLICVESGFQSRTLQFSWRSCLVTLMLCINLFSAAKFICYWAKFYNQMLNIAPKDLWDRLLSTKTHHVVSKMVWFDFGLELRSELLAKVWNSSLRMVQRHAITILIFHGGNGSPALVPPQINQTGNWNKGKVHNQTISE